MGSTKRNGNHHHQANKIKQTRWSMVFTWFDDVTFLFKANMGRFEGCLQATAIRTQNVDVRLRRWRSSSTWHCVGRILSNFTFSSLFRLKKGSFSSWNAFDLNEAESAVESRCAVNALLESWIWRSFILFSTLMLSSISISAKNTAIAGAESAADLLGVQATLAASSYLQAWAW